MNITPDRTTPTGRKWAELIAADRKDGDKPRRKARFTGNTSEKKRWVREQSAYCGRFFTTGTLHNWLNSSMHYHAKAKIKRSQRAVGFAETKQLRDVTLPVLVYLTRYGPHTLDEDEAVSASLKAFRDGVADALGVDDGDTAKVRFLYRQVKARWYAVRIKVVPLPLHHFPGCQRPGDGEGA